MKTSTRNLLIVSLLLLAFMPGPAEAGVCEDRRAACLATCGSVGASACLMCQAEYVKCTAQTSVSPGTAEPLQTSGNSAAAPTAGDLDVCAVSGHLSEVDEL